MRRAVLAIACATLFLPPASADESAQAAFQSATVAWTDGTASSGSALGLVSRALLAPVEDSTFEVHAPILQVETDSARLYLDTGQVFMPLPPSFPLLGSPSVETQAASYTDATLQGTLSRPDRFLYLFPQGPLDASLSCAEAEASTNPELKALSYVNTSRGATTADTTNALQLVPCPGSTLRLRGSFVLILWEWDADGTAQEGNLALWSGKRKQETVPDPTGSANPSPYVTQARQLFLIVHDGTFTIHGNANRPPLLFVADAGLTGASRVTLTDATGNLGATSVSARRMDLAGDLSLNLGRSGSTVAMEVSGLHGATVDGRPFSLASTAPTPAPAWPWLVGIFGAVAVLAAPGVAVPLLRRPARRQAGAQAALAQARDAIGNRQGEEALASASKAVDLEPDNPEALFFRAKLLGQLAPGRALDLHEQVHHLASDPLLLRENALQAALTAARHKPEDTLVWLRRAVEVSARLGREGDLEPAFHCHPELAPYLAALHEPEKAWFLLP